MSGADAALERLIELLARDPEAPTSVTDAAEVRRVHIADSLSGLEFDELRKAKRIADVGSGAGFPGLPLAAELPDAGVDLIEATARKCEFLRRAVAGMGLQRAQVMSRTGRDLGGGTRARVLRRGHGAGGGPASTLAELASPCCGRAVI